VPHKTFAGVHSLMLDVMSAKGLRVDGAYAVWVIQHCLKPAEDLRRISALLKPGGYFCLLNTHARWVPTDIGWGNDGIELLPILQNEFEQVTVMEVPPEVPAAGPRENYFYAICRKGRG
jgi:hypothetical protein